MATLDIVTGDKLPVIVGIVKDSDGNVQDITGWTVKLNATNHETTVSKTAVLSDPTNGEFRVTLLGTEFTAGTWWAEIETTNLTGNPETAYKDSDNELFIINVWEAIA